MRILVFDTETGGCSPIENDILQLSYQVVDTDTHVVELEKNFFFPWPEAKSRVEDGAINVTGLTEEVLATKELSDRAEALCCFFEDMDACDYIVAHNGQFDQKFIDATAERCNVDSGSSCWKPMIDTMRSTTELCKLPPHPGRTGYKWPKLIELAEFLQIRTDDINLHDSSADVELTKRCFMKLLDDGFWRL